MSAPANQPIHRLRTLCKKAVRRVKRYAHFDTIDALARLGLGLVSRRLSLSALLDYRKRWRFLSQSLNTSPTGVDAIYIFVFFGEFGYELLNWQAVIRKFSTRLPRPAKVICCSRANLWPLYDTASEYIDLSSLNAFSRTQASGYFAVTSGDPFDEWQLRTEVMSFILQKLGITRRLLNHLHWPNSPLRRITLFRRAVKEYVFVFSSDKTELNGCVFGSDRDRYGIDPSEGNIYEQLNLDNNKYQRIKPDLGVRDAIERRLGWSLETPFVLCQTRSRNIVIRSFDEVPKERLISALSQRVRVVLLSFNTGRRNDSYSSFPQVTNCFEYSADSFAEQSCLIHFAKECIFFTEGDFGSHIYVPPFMGKDVIAIAPRSVYEIGPATGMGWSTTPIEFWNRNVFRFGGHIIPKVSETIFFSERNLSQLISEVVMLVDASPPEYGQPVTGRSLRAAAESETLSG